MSTNFYIDTPFNQTHIGKRWSMGKGKTGFMYAMPHSHIELTQENMAYCPTCGAKPDVATYDTPPYNIVDEYGAVYTIEAFNKMIAACAEVSTDHIGTEFS